MPAAVNGIKFCPGCNAEKTIAEFSPDRERRDGLQTYCRLCRQQQAKSIRLRRRTSQRPLPPSGHKRCLSCRKTLPVHQFNRDNNQADGLSHNCRPCASNLIRQWRAKKKSQGIIAALYRRHHLKSKYGLTVDEYEAMLAAQGGRCAICGQRETTPRLGKVRNLVIDHDHETGKVRGLLCSTCNMGVGLFQESPDILETAADYLRAYGKV